MSRAAHQSHPARMGAAYPAQPGATRSLTVPTPRMKKAAVSPLGGDLHFRVTVKWKCKHTHSPACNKSDASRGFSLCSSLRLNYWFCQLSLWQLRLCFFLFRPHRLLSLLHAGGKRKKFHQLQLHLTVHPPLVDLWRLKRLWRLRRRDQLPGWAATQAHRDTHFACEFRDRLRELSAIRTDPRQILFSGNDYDGIIRDL